VEKQLIVGIDPGTTVGLAFLDIDGHVLKVKSARNLAIDGIITEIAAVGKAAIVATDKAVVPPMTNKLASILGARLFTPDSDLLVEKKRELAARSKTKNDHERDALASAVYAYYHFQNKIRRVERQVLEELGRTKARVLKGEKVSDIMAPDEGGDECRELRAQLGALRRENRELKEEIQGLRRARPRSPKAILREAAREARDLMVSVARGKLVMLKEVPSLNFLDIKGLPIKKGDLILCRSKGNDSKGLRFLEGRRVGTIITPVKVDSLAPTCGVGELDITSWEGLFFAQSIDIERACGRRKEVRLRDLEDMLTDYKKGRR